MSFIEKKEIQPFGIIYRFKQEEIDAIVKEFVKETIGISLPLFVGCLDEEGADWGSAIFIGWSKEGQEISHSSELQEKIHTFGLDAEEWKENRDAVFEKLFSTEYIAYQWLFDKKSSEYIYEFTLIDPIYLD